MTNGSEGIAEYPGRPDYTALIEEARRASKAVYLATDEAVAADLSRILKDLAVAVEALREHLAAAEALIREMGDATDIRHGGKLDRLDRIAMLAAGYRSEGGDRG